MRNNKYSKKVLEHFQKPRNFGKIKHADGTGKVGNLICGDVMHLYIKVEKGVLTDVKFETFGCVAALATSSVVTELAKGKTIKEALNVKKEEIIKSLGELPQIKIHCSVLAADALSEAIYDYLRKNKKAVPKNLEKKHERIRKEMEILEKRYDEYAKMEKKLLKND